MTPGVKLATAVYLITMECIRREQKDHSPEELAAFDTRIAAQQRIIEQLIDGMQP